MKYPWKQHSRCSPFRFWTSVAPNSVRDTDTVFWSCDCAGCVEEARRYYALMRLVERKQCAYLGKCNSSRCPRHGAEMRGTP